LENRSQKSELQEKEIATLKKNMEEHQEKADNEIKRLKAELKQASREMANQSRLSEQDKPPSVRLAEKS